MLAQKRPSWPLSETRKAEAMRTLQERMFEYLRRGGGKCPHCCSSAIEGGPISIEGDCSTQKVGCIECDEEWVDTYTLTHITSHSKGIELRLASWAGTKIDWCLLRHQKEWLVGQRTEEAEGLLNLLDSLMDQAAEQLGDTIVYGT